MPRKSVVCEGITFSCLQNPCSIFVPDTLAHIIRPLCKKQARIDFRTRFFGVSTQVAYESATGHHPWMKRERLHRRTSSGASVVTRPSAHAVYSRFPWVRGTKLGVPVVSLVGRETARSSRSI